MGTIKDEKETGIIYNRCKYTEELKRHICLEFQQTGTGIRTLAKKYGLSSHSLIHEWLRKYGYVEQSVNADISVKFNILEVGLDSFGIATSVLTSMDSQEPSSTSIPSEYQSEIARLKRELEDAKLKAEAYLRVIEIAENELKLPIRKKSNTK